MKKHLKAYTSFSRTERLGLLFICAVLIILIIIRATMALWMPAPFDPAKQQKLVAVWATFERSKPNEINDTTDRIPNDYQDAHDENAAPLEDIIDINTADSATLVRLKGIGPATAGKIVAYRKEHGPFTRIDQLLEVRSFPPATFSILKRHLVISKTK